MEFEFFEFDSSFISDKKKGQVKKEPVSKDLNDTKIREIHRLNGYKSGGTIR